MPSHSKYVRWSRLHPLLVTIMGQKPVTSVFTKWRWNPFKTGDETIFGTWRNRPETNQRLSVCIVSVRAGTQGRVLWL